jgi:branched-chain amino acid transport system ATP-binding protein
MTATVLSVAGARKAFGGLVAVNDVSFDVHDGELLGLIGPNGSGKTTMLNLISGALRPDSGSIVLAGETISGLPAHQIARRGIARTFQLVRMLPAMDAERNVMAGALFGHRRLKDTAARDVARELLLDEWLAGLNPSELNTGIRLIETLNRQKRTIIIVEHVMDAIRSRCARCVVMNTGRKIKDGRVDDVLADPEVVEAYLGDDDA